MSSITAGDVGGGGGSFSSGNINGGSSSQEVVVLQQQEQQVPVVVLNHHHHHHHPHHLNSSSSLASSTSNSNGSITQQQQKPPPPKKKRNLPGTPDPSAEVIALSPTTLMATNRFVCEICNKGFQRDQNLQLHRRGHNLPWKLRQRTSSEIRKRVYVCPEPSCVHHNPARALGDLTGIKKHFCRKHGEKKWKCDKCSKKYAVHSDWKAHSKTCGTKEYKCDCGTIFSRRDSFITHRAFCDALAEENNKVNQGLLMAANNNIAQAANQVIPELNPTQSAKMASGFSHQETKNNNALTMAMFSSSSTSLFGNARSLIPTSSSSSNCLQLNGINSSSIFEGINCNNNGGLRGDLQLSGSASMSATALLQKAAQMGATSSGNTTVMNSNTGSCMDSPLMMQKSFVMTTMAAPPSFGCTQNNHQSQTLMAMNQTFNSNSNNMGMFNGVFDDQNDNKSSVLSRFSSGDGMTLDFLGIGGSRNSGRINNSSDNNNNNILHDHQEHQELIIEFGSGGINGGHHHHHHETRIQSLNPFQQHAAASMEKPMWEV
ncbi:protein indeterminate-domain 2-like isoform X2 [Carica papaya]|uniref:protein indeterminate-domain 2-like isoform X2 n=1 Tax=Carica papaya TaxID=3649 RepID=UPI000B8C7420|nr:protein indeterminate-domain 2-like isoform X2 [Carica papaya]